MLVRTMHEVREYEGDLDVMVMCSVPSEDPFTLLVRSTDGTALGKQTMAVLCQFRPVSYFAVHAFCIFCLLHICECMHGSCPYCGTL